MNLINFTRHQVLTLVDRFTQPSKNWYLNLPSVNTNFLFLYLISTAQSGILFTHVIPF